MGTHRGILTLAWTNVLFLLPLLVEYSWAGNTTCISSQLDWYTDVVGETPCMTYQRLRQICDNNYQVPDMRTNAPGDNCDSQISTCCCNTIAFQLSMLCMNCQQDRLGGGQSGINAPAGTYTAYRGRCGPGKNFTLDGMVQNAVCNENIWLDEFLFTRIWSDGSWIYTYQREWAVRDHAADNNMTFWRCPNQVSKSPVAQSALNESTSLAPTPSTAQISDSQTALPAQQSDSDDSPSKHSSRAAAIAGGVVGGIIAGLVSAILLVLLRRRRALKAGRALEQTPNAYPFEKTPHHGSNNVEIAANTGAVLGNPASDGHRTDDTTLTPATPFYSGAHSSVPLLRDPSVAHNIRERDAGAVLLLPPVEPMGPLPPAYRSWENQSTTANDGPAGPTTDPQENARTVPPERTSADAFIKGGGGNGGARAI
ncbi:hypothetical protein C8Q77DRAFT_269468 [Trametes polyzona]|nr:hypothetical protein C8Q77DRAFT_269468 [Trametes polyzona]